METQVIPAATAGSTEVVTTAKKVTKVTAVITLNTGTRKGTVATTTELKRRDTTEVLEGNQRDTEMGV